MESDVGVGPSEQPVRTRPRSRRRRSSAHSTTSSMFGELTEYTYALPDSSISEWLKCPICLNPFVDPIIAPRCEHVFCRSCIQQHIDTLGTQRKALQVENDEQRIVQGTSGRGAADEDGEEDDGIRIGQCPTCRSSFDAKNLKPAAALIRNMVDSLLVRCLHEHRGCNHTCERSLLDSHVSRDCQWAYVGEYEGTAAERSARRTSKSSVSGRCECGKKVLRRDWHRHVSTPNECTIERVACPYYSMQEDDAEGCREYVKEAKLDEHMAQCQARPTECQSCHERMSVGQLDLHLHRCAEVTVACTMQAYGCQWSGRRAQFDTVHVSQCTLMPLKSFLEAQERRLSDLLRENQQMSMRMAGMQTELSSLSSLVDQCVQALGSTFIGPSTIPDAVQRRHDVVVPISSPQPHGATIPPPAALQGRSGSSTALNAMSNDGVGNTERVATTVSALDAAGLSTSAPATAHVLSVNDEQGDAFPWPESADRQTQTQERTRRGEIVVARPGEETVSQAVQQVHRVLDTLSDQQTRMQRRLDDSYAVSLNAGFEAGRAHEELNSLRHGMHSVRMQMHSLLMQQQHMMPAMFLGGSNTNAGPQNVASSNANATSGLADGQQLPFSGPSPPQLGLRRYWTGFEQTRL